MDTNKLIKKYNIPAPRYTSYPTVPFWQQEQIASNDWFEAVKKTFDISNDTEGVSLYLHMPFCEKLCTYCGCNKRITVNHRVEEPYIEALMKEWDTYLKVFGSKPNIKEVHIGGGTPTFFSPENYMKLFGYIQSTSNYMEGFDFSFEGHPNNTTYEHLKAFKELGFTRVSYGVQDFDLKVQQTINRIQPYENVKRATEDARSLGFTSVNFDLVYGLPFQSIEVIENTIRKVSELMPDRIAFYSYAHVPWVSPGQRAYTEADLPSDDYKRALYERGKSMLLELGYEEIGMDHFALDGDKLLQAHKDRTIHRNFMGYTTNNTELLVGLGCSSISDAKIAYAQNIKKVEDYQKAIEADSHALTKGHLLNDSDLLLKQAILDLICKEELVLTNEIKSTLTDDDWNKLKDFQAEEVLAIHDDKVSMTEMGMTFIRNVCMVFDQRLKDSQRERGNLFSKSI
ncbi:oxygen-independent coproporphyrinogen III oxidase [Aureibacter tunicatorum]|uniref:Coproporphyrinogen-III oxidase n=1 Tax=Aureibacter tunicatorum TaxID=866807 RepID=A0AAE3XRZ1_9BACT|nr:oxygen-independent coproporphyrinogen III oxidase [Aureibacter tunicatorum]MDR6240364.1 oxygen-independent coproporphyrinogen-3 oxidase [Aureibacter tunicatorum]BDD05755.1 coproporphyrinogen-III oxidase [Aureibacter tunicatorum]